MEYNFKLTKISFIFSIVILFLEFVLFYENKLFLRNADIIEGKISKIEIDSSYKNNHHYDIYVNYIYNGNVYKNIILRPYIDTNFPYKEGDDINLYLNSLNPEKVKTDYFSKVYYLLYFYSFLFFCGSFSSFISAWKKTKKNLILKQTGKKLICHIKDIQTDYNLKKGSEPSRIAICSYKDYSTNKNKPIIKIFTSEPNFFITEEDKHKKIDVYIDEKNKEYYVDLESIERKSKN